MPMLPLLVYNHRLPVLHMAKRFIWIEETGKRISQFDIGYIIYPSFHGNQKFKEEIGTV